jgi:hypothetical protein
MEVEGWEEICGGVGGLKGKGGELTGGEQEGRFVVGWVD